MKLTPEQELTEAVRTSLKTLLKNSGVTYAELAVLLQKMGFDETEDSITAKLKRGTFSAVFRAAVYRALGVDDGSGKPPKRATRH